MAKFMFNLENVTGKPFRKYPQYEELTKLLLAMVENDGLVPEVFVQAVHEYNECLGYRSHALMLWLAGIVKAYDPREAEWGEVDSMHKRMLESGKYTQDEIDGLTKVADLIYEQDQYGKVLPDAVPLEKILEFYLKKYQILE